MGGKTATSSSSVNIPPEVLARYNAVNTQAEQAAKTPFQAFGNQASDYVAQINQQQMAGINNINQAAGSYQPFMSAATDATKSGMGPAYAGISNYMSPYIQNVADTTGAMMRQSNEQAQSGALGAAAASGAFGGDRAGVSAANLNQQNQMAYGKTMADIMNQGYMQALGASQADLARQMQGGAQLAGLGAQEQALGLQGAQAQIGAGTMQQQTEQAGKSAMIDRFMQEKGYPFQIAQFLANIAMGTGAQSGSTTTTQMPTGIFGNILRASGGKVDGYAEGGGVAGPRTHLKEGIGGEGYVPAGDLPIGQLMTASPPQGGDNTSQNLGNIMQIATMMAGKANGGAAIGRHGYADGGYPVVDDPVRHSVFVSNAGNQPDFRGAPPEFPTRHSVLVSGSGDQPATLGSLPAIPTPAPGLGGVRSDQRPMPRPDDLWSTMRPQPRPEGLGGADIARDAMTAIGRTARAPQGGVALPAQTATAPSGNMVDTGKVPTGVVAPIIPLEKQIDFMLQEPQYRRYLSYDYASPADAATGMDEHYEISGGQGRREAALYANDVYKAAQSGDLSGLPQNAQTIYNSLIQRGIDPVKAAGTVGRLMVESYARIDPNARNTLGGGNGTIGIAQWRGDRMENLAKFAGVPIDAITGAPVSTPEGRYYSTGSRDGLAGGASGDQIAPAEQTGGLGAANMAPAPTTTNAEKPYAERNMIGKFFHDPLTGKINPIAIKSLLGGLSSMAQANTISPISAILQGLGGGMETYAAAQKQASDIGFTNSQTATAAVQMLKNSISSDPYTGISYVPLQGGGQQSFVDFLRNPAGPSMAGVAADNILRGMASNAVRSGINLETATPEQIMGGATSVPPPGQPPAAGMPAQSTAEPYQSQGTFALDDRDQAYIAQAQAQASRGMTQQEREAQTAQTAEKRAEADSGTAAASMSFRNNNELAATVARASANNDLGPLGEWKARAENLASQVAKLPFINIQYDGTTGTSQALLNKLSSLSADQMTADTAAASLYLQNKGIFPDITTNQPAAAELTAEMLTKNMNAYEKGLYMNDLYRAQTGPMKTLVGADALFNEKTGSIYQGEKANIADLLKVTGNAEIDPEIKGLVVDFFESANRGAFRDEADAQKALEAIFSVLPGQHNVSSGLGRYFVQ